MFCPQCGKETKKGLCKDCFFERNPIRLKKFLVSLCNCGRYVYQGKLRENFDRNLMNIIKKNLIIPKEIKFIDIHVNSNFTKDKILLVIIFNGIYKEEKIKKNLNFSLKIKKILCDFCKKMSSDYYEGILQIRNFEPAKLKFDEKFVSKVKKVKNGFDFFINKRGYLKQMARKFRRDKKNFYVEESHTAIGRKEGKRKSKLIVLIKKKNI